MQQVFSILGKVLKYYHCSSFFQGDTCTILRGTWFYDGTWQPVEEGYAKQIETEYLGKFLGKRLDESTTLTDKGQKYGK